MNILSKTCLLCLENHDNLLDIFGKKGIDLNIGVILQQHFWFEVDTFAAKNICEVCWQKVESFHIFYNFVKSIHQQQAEPRGEQTRATKSTTETGLIHCFKEEPIDIKDFSDDFTATLNTIDSLAPSAELEVDINYAKGPTTVARTILKSKRMKSASYGITDPPTARRPAPVAQKKWKYICETSTSTPPNQYKTDARRSDDFEVDRTDAKKPARVTRTARNTKPMSLTSADTTDSTNQRSDGLEVDASKILASVSNENCKSKRVRLVSSLTVDRNTLRSDELGVDSTTVAPKKRKYNCKTSTSPPPYQHKTDVHTPLLSQYFDMSCDRCDTLMSSFKDTKKHYEDVHGVAKGYLICCNMKYIRLQQMLSHCEWHMNPDAFNCSQCSRNFHDKYRLQQHMNASHPPEDKKKFNCNDCDKKFSKRFYLTAHRKNYHDPSLKCPVCEKYFTGKRSLRNHIRDDHSEEDEREFLCNRKQMTKLGKKMYVSTDRVLEKARPFECDICGCRFGSLVRLKNHIRRKHVDALPHVCEICAKSFVSSENYKYHYINVHGNMSEKASEKVQCDICGKWFKNKPSIYKHMICHTSKPATCTICGRVSSNRRALRVHINNTHRKASLECNICGKMIKTKKTLKEHMAIHYGITDLYTCAFCPKTFRSNANMHSHRKRAHPVETENLKKN